MKKIKVGIVGGAGYTAGELLRILLNHPHVDLVFVHSSSNAGNLITSVHSGLIGETDLVFSANMALEAIDLLFLCSAHGDSKKFMQNHTLSPGIKIIDLSTDFRIASHQHHFIYGLPEWNRNEIQKANRIANPGCFATAIQLALLPLASHKLLQGDVHIHAITGSTGAGVQPSSTTHYSWRSNNISIYKPFTHQHLHEIEQTITQLQPQFSHALNFIPVRGNFTRGIFVTAYTPCSLSLSEVRQRYEAYYADAVFTFISNTNPDLKQVINTNKAVLYLEKHGHNLLIVSAIDNLLKGASGQAVHNMNLMYNLDEKAGLLLKSTGF